ncbi:MAG: hypothetical protein ACK2UL_00155 [Anaerolineae bacterium]
MPTTVPTTTIEAAPTATVELTETPLTPTTTPESTDAFKLYAPALYKGGH